MVHVEHGNVIHPPWINYIMKQNENWDIRSRTMYHNINQELATLDNPEPYLVCHVT